MTVQTNLTREETRQVAKEWLKYCRETRNLVFKTEETPRPELLELYMEVYLAEFLKKSPEFADRKEKLAEVMRNQAEGMTRLELARQVVAIQTGFHVKEQEYLDTLKANGYPLNPVDGWDPYRSRGVWGL